MKSVKITIENADTQMYNYCLDKFQAGTTFNLLGKVWKVIEIDTNKIKIEEVL